MSVGEDVGTVWVECPFCTQTFPTHDVGDVVRCIDEHCEKRFPRFSNIVDEPHFPEWQCPHCGRMYDETPEECKCQRDAAPFQWLYEEAEPEQFFAEVADVGGESE